MEKLKTNALETETNENFLKITPQYIIKWRDRFVCQLKVCFTDLNFTFTLLRIPFSINLSTFFPLFGNH